MEGPGWATWWPISSYFFKKYQTQNSITFSIGGAGKTYTKRVLNGDSMLNLTDFAKNMLQSYPEQFVKTYSSMYMSDLTYGWSFLGDFNIALKDYNQDAIDQLKSF